MAETAKHWAEVNERGAAWGPVLMAFIYRTLGRSVCLVVLAPVIAYFFATGGRQRRASIDYLGRVFAFSGRPGRPGFWHALKHFFVFGTSLLDKFGAWIGQVDRKDVEAIDGGEFNAMRDDARGTLILSAHIGATEIVRAIATRYQPRRINIVIHTNHAAQYNAVIERVAPQSKISLIPAAEFDVSAAVTLSAAIERGEWVVMMGDRMPVSKVGRVIMADFLGAQAAFPQGPFVLAAALRCPIYTLFCYRQDGRYRVSVKLMSDGVAAPRAKRTQAIAALVQRFARAMEGVVQAAPYQWFNFYDYWADGRDGGGGHASGGKD